MSAKGFASSLLAELRAQEPAAAALSTDIQPDSVAIGVRYPEGFLPLVGLANPSAGFNVMNLFIWNDGQWVPTMQRGTPAKLAQVMLGFRPTIWLKYAREVYKSDAPDEG